MPNQFHAFLFVLGGASPSVCRTIPLQIESEIFEWDEVGRSFLQTSDMQCYKEKILGVSILLFGLGPAEVMQCNIFSYLTEGSIREISTQHQFETESSKRSTRRRTADVFATEEFAHENLLHWSRFIAVAFFSAKCPGTFRASCRFVLSMAQVQM